MNVSKKGMVLGEIRYFWVKHNDNLFSVRSYVCNTDMFGLPHVFENFVAETASQEEAEKLIASLYVMTE